MSPPASAEIIPFPARLPLRDGPSRPVTGAMGGLVVALADQHAALLDWQAALGELSSSLHNLGQTLEQFETVLNNAFTL